LGSPLSVERLPRRVTRNPVRTRSSMCMAFPSLLALPDLRPSTVSPKPVSPRWTGCWLRLWKAGTGWHDTLATLPTLGGRELNCIKDQHGTCQHITIEHGKYVLPSGGHWLNHSPVIGQPAQGRDW